MSGQRGNRHRRGELDRQAVLDAAGDLLVTEGFAGVTMEGIAARAGVSRQAVHRWWPTKADVLMDAFLQDAEERLTPADSGDLGADLRAHLRALAGFLTGSVPGAVVKALIGQAQHDQGFALAFRTRFVDGQRRRDRLPLDRAVRRGQLPVDVGVPAALDQLVGPVYYRALITGEAIDAAFTDGLVDAFLRAAHGDAGTARPAIAAPPAAISPPAADRSA